MHIQSVERSHCLLHNLQLSYLQTNQHTDAEADVEDKLSDVPISTATSSCSCSLCNYLQKLKLMLAKNNKIKILVSLGKNLLSFSSVLILVLQKEAQPLDCESYLSINTAQTLLFCSSDILTPCQMQLLTAQVLCQLGPYRTRFFPSLLFAYKL